MTTDQIIGENVHRLMWRNHIRQDSIYRALGVSRSTFAKKLRGEIAWLAKDIDAAAKTLGVEPGALFAEWTPAQPAADVTRGYRTPSDRPVLHLVEAAAA